MGEFSKDLVKHEGMSLGDAKAALGKGTKYDALDVDKRLSDIVREERARARKMGEHYRLDPRR